MDFDVDFLKNVTEMARKAYNFIDHNVQDWENEPANLQEISFWKGIVKKWMPMKIILQKTARGKCREDFKKLH